MRGRFFCSVGAEHEFELGGIELLAGHAEDAAGQGVDHLAQYEDLGGLTFDDGIAFGDLIELDLFFSLVHGCWNHSTRNAMREFDC
jgi:hypothetical protein